MRILGDLMRSILNINTIWGLMILSAFVLCVGQHYTPTTTLIPGELLRDGENRLTILAPGSDGTPQACEYTLRLVPGELRIAPDDQIHQPNRPWLISTRRVDAGYALRWDTHAHGDCEIFVGDTPVAAPRIVKLQSLTDAAFDYAEIGFKIALGLVSVMVLFLGLMKVGEKAGIVQLVARVFYPIIRFLFPDVPKDHPANGAILMNWTTTVLGLGNAATPFGLKAMQELQSLNKHPDVASNSQIMLLGFNTAGFTLLPTTLIAMRNSAGCARPLEIIGTCMIAGLVATITAIVMVKVLGKLPMFSVQAAEDARQHEEPAMTGDGEGA